MKTYGMQPGRHWKLFEHDGFQVLAYVDYDEDEDSYGLVLEGYVDELGDTSAIRMGAKNTRSEEVARQLFDALADAEKVVTTWLNQVGPAVEAMRP